MSRLQWQHVDPSHGRLTLRARDRVYSYQSGDTQVSLKYVSALDLASGPAPKVDYAHDLDKLVALSVGAPSAGVLTSLVTTAALEDSELLRSQRTLYVLVGASLGAAALGYHLVHRTLPGYDDEVFRKNTTGRAGMDG